MLRSVAITMALWATAGIALAGSADNAQAHFNAIASADMGKIMEGYADSAILQWVGGPLDGAYSGADKVKEVWGKFTKVNGPLEVKVSKMEESANPKGATVSANVVFTGKSAIKVRYVLVYREGKLVNEIWQIDPNLMMGY